MFTHRPLFDLYPQWDWATRDGAQAIELLMPYRNVTVFYGHIHQEHHHMTGHIAHHSAKSLIFPLPRAGLAARSACRSPGIRRSPTGAWVSASRCETETPIQDHRVPGREGLNDRTKAPPAARSPAPPLAFGASVFAQRSDKVIRIVARKFEFTPGEITLEKACRWCSSSPPDVTMGFDAPDFKVDAEIVPGKVVRVRLVPDRPARSTSPATSSAATATRTWAARST